MNTEIEAKFVNVSIDDVRSNLTKLGAVLEQPMRLMKRVTIDSDFMRSNNAFLRIRDEGNKITITYKQFDSLSVDGAKEIETTVGDFAVAVSLVAAIGIPHKSYQETKRETWKLDDTEVVIDVWPWLNPYIEIEGPSETRVKDVASLLGFQWENAVFGDVMEAYKIQYPHLKKSDTVGNIPEVKFNTPLPDLFVATS
ncbi:TPA: adenylyl cyclase [Candidatus Saccharibacteria bacterium]|nr:adenylyl cyclase [Candidatus Saccharibacteria bacterium]|tara:strand:+ start:847 stop:1437 length:591 start_codon:yes stop_codon:yes gene_type:complete